MSKIFFQNTNIIKDMFDKKGRPKHEELIPKNKDDLVAFFKAQEHLTPYQKKVLFVIVSGIIDIFNETRLHLWYPDMVKDTFVAIFAILLSKNKTLLRLLENDKS